MTNVVNARNVCVSARTAEDKKMGPVLGAWTLDSGPLWPLDSHSEAGWCPLELEMLQLQLQVPLHRIPSCSVECSVKCSVENKAIQLQRPDVPLR